MLEVRKLEPRPIMIGDLVFPMADAVRVSPGVNSLPPALSKGQPLVTRSVDVLFEEAEEIDVAGFVDFSLPWSVCRLSSSVRVNIEDESVILEKPSSVARGSSEKATVTISAGSTGVANELLVVRDGALDEQVSLGGLVAYDGPMIVLARRVSGFEYVELLIRLLREVYRMGSRGLPRRRRARRNTGTRAPVSPGPRAVSSASPQLVAAVEGVEY